MKSFLIKNKKYTFMIIFFICCFFFIGKVDALVFKGKDYNNGFVQRNKSGILNTANNISVVRFEFATPIDIDAYEGIDLFGVKFDRLNFGTNSTISNNNSAFTFQCSSYVQAANGDGECDRAGINPTSSSSNSSIRDGDITIVGYVLQNGGGYIPCWFSDEIENTLLCPFVEDNVKYLDVEISYSGYDTINYDLFVGNMKVLYNYDSTEIRNALTQLGVIQQNTTTTIQNFNNYVSDSNTTQAQTNQTTALGNINNTFTQHLSGMNELTQLVFLPINFVMQVANNQCQPLVWDIPFVNQRVVVPCMSTIYNGYFSAIVGTLSTIFMGLLTYRATIKLFNAFKGVLDAEDDKIEVIDL